MGFPSNQEMLKRYYELCDQRDAIYEQVQPLEDQLSGVNAQIEPLRIKALELATQIDSQMGRNFIDIKQEIRQIASYLGRIPPRPEKQSLLDRLNPFK
jgi:uncharacterized coiled-coil DUF342 family protein